MSFGVISYILLKKHRSATPIDHPDESVTRAKLEYPTEDVSLAYLGIINKVTSEENPNPYWFPILTYDSFTDKGIQYYSLPDYDHSFARWVDKNNYYTLLIDTTLSTSDFRIIKKVGGTPYVIATESIDLETVVYLLKFEAIGSTLKGYRSDMTTPKLTITDTTFASGKLGIVLVDERRYMTAPPELAWLKAPASSLPPARAIVETEITGSGSDDDPYRADLLHQIEDHPELGRIDKLSITWGSFDHKHTHSHMLLIITGDNPYESGAIGKQKEYAKRVFDPPSDYAQAVELYRKLRHDYPDWVAGKDNFVYHVFGWSVLELFAIADCYYGFLIEHKTRPQYDQIKRVPDWELRRTINRWLGKLKSLTVLTEERNKHIKKLEEVLRLGW